ncbi:helix-turn-helix transcriptional regulator [Cupriavidus neocaledonicus]|uniref:HTH luxR-type domain-containing protein n=1 Tax=Cupriavidus neocaledonicus TaxID=1040979 RepID=A0A375H8T8_9BURK|nr:helix-turn-helix transcriptional regulator [Cupriavidus neocaledonicus]SOZ34875.1 hypothetical protein CBM2605_A140105 [Cupriavidus neocaledonicus]SPD46647.1 conserved protein of unknown function [Cupriavidus neocaledonicus]
MHNTQTPSSLLELYALAADAEVRRAGDRLLGWLAGHICFDAAWFGRSTLEAGLLAPHDSHIRGLDPDFVADWRRVRHVDPVAPAAMRRPGCGIAMKIDELPLSSLRAFGEDHRIGGVLGVVLHTSASPWWTHLALYRREPAAYCARDQALLELLTPHASALDLRRPKDAALALLSPREAEVARLFGMGQSYKAVARALGSSPATVRHHLRQAYAKLGITSKVQMARLVCGQATEA